jgi:hypothetical protein
MSAEKEEPSQETNKTWNSKKVEKDGGCDSALNIQNLIFHLLHRTSIVNICKASLAPKSVKDLPSFYEGLGCKNTQKRGDLERCLFPKRDEESFTL